MLTRGLGIGHAYRFPLGQNSVRVARFCSRFCAEGENAGRIPESFGFHLAHVAQLVEHVLGKDEVTGSNPVMGSVAVKPRAGTLMTEFRSGE